MRPDFVSCRDCKHCYKNERGYNSCEIYFDCHFQDKFEPIDKIEENKNNGT